MIRTVEQRVVIKTILVEARKISKKTVAQISAECGDAETRSTYYRARDGKASDEQQLAVFISCNTSASLLDEYTSACAISLSSAFLRPKLIAEYIYSHDSNYDIDELDAILIAANQPPLVRRRAA